MSNDTSTTAPPDPDTGPTPTASVPMPVSRLVPNPRNVRANMHLTDYYLRRIKANGVKVPVVAVAQDDGTFMVTMGHRRLAAAKMVGLEEIPVYVVEADGREAGEDFIEQLVENDADGREPLSELEQADALFGAAEAGMDLATVATRTGKTKAAVEQAVTTARTVGPGTRRALAQADDYEWTTEVLSVLGEFDDDPDAVERLITAHTSGYFAHQVTREENDRAETRARDQRRSELEAAGVRLLENPDDLGDDAQWLGNLVDAQGEPLDEDAHTACPGHVVTWDDDASEPEAILTYCLHPQANDHHDPAEFAPPPDPDSPTDDVSTSPAAPGTKDEGLPHKVKIEGNKAWRAALATRQDWLRGELFNRKTAPKPMQRFLTEQWLICPKPLQMWTGEVSRTAILAELLGQDKQAEAAQRAGWVPAAATPGRMVLTSFAIFAACFEKRITESQTWRHDKPQYDTEDIRADARTYLEFLGTIGYPLSPIEQAVISGEPYTPQDAPQPSEDEGDEGKDDAAEGDSAPDAA